MSRPDLDALAALLDKATQQEGAADTSAASLECLLLDTQEATNARDTLIAALPGLLAYVQELERERDAAALAMRERCAQACEELSLHYEGQESEASSRVYADLCRGSRNGADACAAAIRALEV